MAYSVNRSISQSNTEERFDRHLKLDDPLAKDFKPIKIGEDVTGLQLADKDVRVEGDLNVAGDISIEGGDLNFTNVIAETLQLGEKTAVDANSTDSITFTCNGAIFNGSEQSGDIGVGIFGQSDEDSKLILYNGINAKWTIGNDADDSNKLKIDNTTASVGGNTKLTLDGSGNATLTGTLAVNGDEITTDGNMNLDAGGTITLDAHDGNFVAKKAGTEFSVANSAYAGMILGYRTIGENATHESYALTTSYSVPDSDMTVRFIAPPSGVVEVMVQVLMNSLTSNKTLYLGLSDNATYNTIGGQYEQLVNYPDETDDAVIQNFWTISGLTAGSTYNYWLGAKTSGTNKSLAWGGNSANRYPTFIMKVTALPTAVSDFAVYG